jgi:hypothetical protein
MWMHACSYVLPVLRCVCLCWPPRSLVPSTSYFCIRCPIDAAPSHCCVIASVVIMPIPPCASHTHLLVPVSVIDAPNCDYDNTREVILHFSTQFCEIACLTTHGVRSHQP